MEVNPYQGIALVEQVANTGDPSGLSVLSWHKLYGHHTCKNRSLAFQLSEKAVAKGYQRASMNLAMCYMHGIGVERNAAKAVRL